MHRKNYGVQNLGPLETLETNFQPDRPCFRAPI